jgi:hypothetical protein
MSLFLRGRSLSLSVGIDASASGGSGVSCRRLRVCAHAGAHLGEPRAFLFGLALALLRIRREDHGRAVRIVDEVALDQTLEVAALVGETGLDRGERLLERERRERIAVVEPSLQGPQHDGDAAGKAAGVVLAQRKFDRIEGGFDFQRIDAIFGECSQRVENERLDLVRIGGVDVLQPDRERDLPQVVVDAPTGNVLAKAGVDQRLVKWRSRGADHDLLQHADAYGSLLVLDLVQHPIDGHHRLAGVRFDLARGIGARYLLRRVEPRLQRDRPVDLDRLKLAQARIEEPQPLLGIIVAVEEQTRRGRMVVLLVKSLEPGVGQVRDILGVAAGIDAIGRLGE